MTSDERTAWLADLKVGEDVAVLDRPGEAFNVMEGYTIYRVDHISPKRTKFILKSIDGKGGEWDFDRYGGRQIGGTWGQQYNMEPVTPEILAKNADFAKRRRAVRVIKQLGKLSDLTTAHLVRIADAILTPDED